MIIVCARQRLSPIGLIEYVLYLRCCNGEVPRDPLVHWFPGKLGHAFCDAVGSALSGVISYLARAAGEGERLRRAQLPEGRRYPLELTKARA